MGAYSTMPWRYGLQRAVSTKGLLSALCACYKWVTECNTGALSEKVLLSAPYNRR
jgi:hypothetical protein